MCEFKSPSPWVSTRFDSRFFCSSIQEIYGTPSYSNIVVSDNGKTFHDAKDKNLALLKNISWQFKVPTASWWGGFFEICVKLVKRSLKKVIGNAKLSYEELETTLIEIVGVLNSRPLTYVYDEITEQPITPSCLVIGCRLMSQPKPLKFGNEQIKSVSLSKRGRYSME